MRRLTTYVRMTAFRRGVLGSSQGWFALWAAIGAARFLKKRLDREPVVERIELKPGQSVLISDTGIPRKAFKGFKAREVAGAVEA